VPRNRQQIPWEERAGELLAAATELLLTRGYAGTTMADISAAAGVARGNVYWYFKSKDDIFAAVMDRMLSREIRTLSEELAGADPLTQLVRGLTDMRPYKSVAHRASKHVRARRKRFEPVGAETAELTEQFMIAASTGDMDGLLSLLAPDAIWTADSGGKGPPRLGSRGWARKRWP
jgi:AcrR family transcriptional regulator